MPGSTKNDEEQQLKFRRCREHGLGNLRDLVLMTLHICIRAKYGLGLGEGAG